MNNVVIYKGPIGQDTVVAVCNWLEEYIGPEDQDWRWQNYRIMFKTNEDATRFKLSVDLPYV